MVAPVSMRQVAVIGAADCTDEEYTAAERVGGLLADHHAILFCGGLGGVMEASVRGQTLTEVQPWGLSPEYRARTTM